MDKKLQSQCDLFVKNRKTLEAMSRFDLPDLQLIGSAIFTFKNLEADLDKVKQANEILKQNTGPLSAYRDNLRLLICCKMAIAKDPEQYLKGVQAVYEIFRSRKVFSSEFHLFAATIIYDALAAKSNFTEKDIENYIEKTYEIYKKLKKNHPFLTSEFSIPFSAMLATSDKNIEKKFQDLEACFEKCKSVLGSKSASQALSQALILADGDINEKCDQVLELWTALKEAGFKLGKGHQIAALAATAYVDYDRESLIKDIIAIDDYLKHQKGFGIFGVSAESRRAFAIVLALNNQVVKNSSPAQELAINAALALAIELELDLILITMISTSTVAIANSN